jgi:hypothetical protein
MRRELQAILPQKTALFYHVLAAGRPAISGPAGKSAGIIQ